MLASFVTPGLTRGSAAGVELEESGTPGQVRGDEEWKGVMKA